MFEVQGVNLDKYRIVRARPSLRVSYFGRIYYTSNLYDHEFFFWRSTAIMPEVKGSKQTPILRCGGRTNRRLARGVDRVNSVKVMQIHRPFLLSFI